ncbi:MAG: aminopeptidase [Candidatus Methanofastidiosia archaeon]
MADSRIERLAEVLVRYSVEVKRDEKVVIGGSLLAEPLIEEVYKEVVKQGAHPTMQVELRNLGDIFFKYAKKHQLEHLSPFTKFMVENADVIISLWADVNPKHFTNVNPEKIKKKTQAQREITEIYMKRVASGDLRWTLGPHPTHGMAQEASMSLLEYEEFVYGACLVHKKDPVKRWKKISEKQEKIVSYLNKTKELKITGEDTELTMSCEGRKWINCDGKKNMPDGEVFTGPIENSAKGVIRFTYPAIYASKEVEDIRLTFKKGKVVKAEAKKGEELLREMLKVDEGAKKIGEIAIGTNFGIQRFTKNMLFDEKMGGTLHLALGRSIPESGGVNISSIHWDMLKDMKKDAEIYADSELFYKNGRFLI